MIQCHSQGCPWGSSNIYVTINFFKVVFIRLAFLKTVWLDAKFENFNFDYIFKIETYKYFQ